MKKLALFFVSALFLAGCANEQLQPEAAVVSVEATAESLVEGTKANVSDEGAFTWQAGDVISAYKDDGSNLNSNPLGVGGSVTANFEFANTWSSSDYPTAYYPSDVTYDSGKVKVPATRAWVANNTAPTMRAEYSDAYNFKHLGGVVRVQIVNVPTDARKFVFKTPGYKINGEFTPVVNAGVYSIETATSDVASEQTFTLSFDAPAAGTTMNFYVPVPVGTYANGFSISLLNESDVAIYAKTGAASQDVALKQLILMSPITLAGGVGEGATTILNAGANYSGDFVLPNTTNDILINFGESTGTVNLVYGGSNHPANIEIQVEGTLAKLTGNLPYSHVEFTAGTIEDATLLTSATTFVVVHPAKISKSLTIAGGNAEIKGHVRNIVIADGATGNNNITSPEPVSIKIEAPAAGAPAEDQYEPVSTITANESVNIDNNSGENIPVIKGEDEVVVTVPTEDIPIVPSEPSEGVVAIGDAKFKTLAEAIAVVLDGETITILEDITDAVGISVDTKKTFTVDFGGKTYTLNKPGAGSTGTTTLGFQLLQGQNITFKNGTINCSEANKTATWESNATEKGIAMMINNYCNLTLEDMTIDGTNIAHNGENVRYIVSNNSGNVEFKGNTSIVAPEGDIAFDVCKYASYPTPVVTWNSTGNVVGGIELSGGEFVVKAPLALTAPIKAIADAKLTVNANVTSETGNIVNISNGKLDVSGSGDITAKGDVFDITTTKAENSVTLNLASGLNIVSETGDCVFISRNNVSTNITVNSAANLTSRGDYAPIYVNGSIVTDGVKINITGGIIHHNHDTAGVGVYIAGKADVSVSGNPVITGECTGLEIRAGSLEVSGGTFNGNGDPFGASANGNGSTTVGAAVAVSQHTTNLPISVEISGGIFNGVRALYEEDLEDDDVVAGISLSVSGGIFNGSILSENCTEFISGGTFYDPSAFDYLADNANVKVGKNMTLAGAIKIDNTATIDLNGFNITAPKSDAFEIIDGGDLTIDNKSTTESTVYAGVSGGEGVGSLCAVWAHGGKATINNGTFRVSQDKDGKRNDCIYAGSNSDSKSGEIIINGGKFEFDWGGNEKNLTNAYNGDQFLLNCADNVEAAKITVNGGSFKNHVPGKESVGDGEVSLGEGMKVYKGNTEVTTAHSGDDAWYNVK